MDEGTNNVIDADSANHNAMAGINGQAATNDGDGQAVVGANNGGAANSKATARRSLAPTTAARLTVKTRPGDSRR